VKVLLGREWVESRLARFTQTYTRVLANRIGEIKRIDLRYPNGFAVAWKANAVPGEASNSKRG
jgi:cell division protein FtsQ